jgi:hypothetical protein
MQAALARVSGGRFLSGPETTTGYRLPTLPGWTEMIRALVSGLRIPAELLLGEPGRAAVQERLLRQSARKGDAFHHAVMIALLRKEGPAAQRLDRPGASVATQKTLS